ncbi:MAG: UvrD-helicase domain-containing protein [Candidatus Nanosynbacter sp.]|nr:UvrD-helicase domain-containing protein [Candidatus Nanosynbacter sp.]
MSKNLTTKNLFKKAEIDHISNISSARFSARQSSNKSLDTLPPDFRVENHPLDSEQRKAIYDPARFNLTVAGAGSGKTTTILGKILYLLQSGFTSPPEILVLSFTHDSATELRERFLREYYQTFAEQILLRKSPPPDITIETFHSLALKLLRKLWPDFSVTTNEIGDEQSVSEIDNNPVSDFDSVSGSDELTIQTSIIREFLDLHELDSITLSLIASKFSSPDYSELFLTVSEKYQRELSSLLEKHQTTFSGLIKLAIRYLRSGQIKTRFRYIIVDEYQDLSVLRQEFLRLLLESSQANLFAVGDDWQAIYGFSGSRVDFTLNFRRFWGDFSLHRISKTYRFGPTLARLSSGFIMQDHTQIRKQIQSQKEDALEPVVEISGDSERLNLEVLTHYFESLPRDSSILLLGRFQIDRLRLLHCTQFKLTSDSIEFQTRPDLKIRFLTVHQSKGLETDYVIILNNREAKLGFPAHVKDPPLKAELIKIAEELGLDQVSVNEERRLFYVALTRAKKQVILLTVDGKESSFIKELRRKFREDFTTYYLSHFEKYLKVE